MNATDFHDFLVECGNRARGASPGLQHRYTTCCESGNTFHAHLRAMICIHLLFPVILGLSFVWVSVSVAQNDKFLQDLETLLQSRVPDPEGYSMMKFSPPFGFPACGCPDWGIISIVLRSRQNDLQLSTTGVPSRLQHHRRPVAVPSSEALLGGSSKACDLQ